MSTRSNGGTARQLVGDGLWLGVDVGTQGVRAVLVDSMGTVLSSGAHALPAGRREGTHHEQDPDDWWAALCAAAREATSALAGRPVDGLAIDSTSGTIVIRTPDGEARGPALMYDDGRAVEQARLAQQVGGDLWSSLGYRMQPAWALPKLRWLVEHDRVRTGDQVVHQGDHLGSRLTGHRVASDTSSALKTGYDLVHMRWPAAVLAALGIPEELLPDVVLPGTRIGTVSAAAAEQTGIPVGTPLVAGMTDGCAAQVAAAALRPGSWSSSLGTTLVVKGATEDLLRDPQGAVYSHRHPDGGWLPGGASSSGAGPIARDLPGRDLDRLTGSAAACFPLPGFSYPLVGRGERFPFVAPDAVSVSATAADLTGKDADVARMGEVMQGVALVERLAYDVLAALGADISGAVTLSGGASRNRTWNQLRCDVLGRPVLVPRAVDAALGSAIIAAAPVGHLTETAERMVRIDTSLEPDTRDVQRWHETYHTFCAELVSRGWLDVDRLPAGQAA